MKSATIPRPYRTRPARIDEDMYPGTVVERLPGIDWGQDIVISEYVVPQEHFVHAGHRYLSLTKLAEDSSLSLSHLSKIMHRTRVPSFQAAIRLARAMGVTLDELAVRLGLVTL